jgi:hypothetical protein
MRAVSRRDPCSSAAAVFPQVTGQRSLSSVNLGFGDADPVNTRPSMEPKPWQPLSGHNASLERAFSPDRYFAAPSRSSLGPVHLLRSYTGRDWRVRWNG